MHLLLPTVRLPDTRLSARETGRAWLGIDAALAIVQHDVRLTGYQIYAVQKWILQRTPLPVLTVYTGDPSHSILVSVLAPDTDDDCHAAIRHLTRHRARPIHTVHGTLVATSLAHFPSHYTIVHIPHGNFLAARRQLYSNINLLRIGCAPRSALTLDDPSDATKEQFIDLYHLPRQYKAQAAFASAVLQLFRLVQAALCVFGMFPPILDGLLCDLSLDGIHRWLAEIGEPCVAIPAIDRTVDPALVSALLSLLLATRNKLFSLGLTHVVRDPFLHPDSFLAALASYAPTTHLSRSLLDSISSAYEEGRKVRRALKSKLEDLVPTPDPDPTRIGPASVLEPTTDLAAFVRAVLGGKDSASRRGVAASVRALWSGRVDNPKVDPTPKWRERWALGVVSDGDIDDRRRDDRSEEDLDAVSAWTGMQKKLGFGSWAAANKRKSKHRYKDSHSPSRHLGTQSPTLHPSLFGDEDMLSSGQVSPISDHPPANPFRSPDPSALNLASLSAFPTPKYSVDITHTDEDSPVKAKRPWNGRPALQTRICSWSDPISARDEPEKPHAESDMETHVPRRQRRRPRLDPTRRRSFHDLDSLRCTPTLPIDYLRIDVDLAGHLLTAARRTPHLHNVLACLSLLSDTLSSANAALREDYSAHQALFASLEDRLRVAAEVERERGRADRVVRETKTMLYESEQFRVGELWHMARMPRAKVLGMRERVFGAGGGGEDGGSGGTARSRRLPPGVHGAHGSFDRLQWTLDGQERLVDQYGRTESEAEEEEAVVSGLAGAVYGVEQRGEEKAEGQGGAEGASSDDEGRGHVVEHPGIKPMWLLRFFTSWGARWGASALPSPSPSPAVGAGGQPEGRERAGTRSSIEPEDHTASPS